MLSSMLTIPPQQLEFKRQVLGRLALGEAIIMGIATVSGPFVENTTTAQIVGYAIALLTALLAYLLARRSQVALAIALVFISFSAILLQTLLADTGDFNNAVLRVFPFFLLQLPAAALIYNSRFSLLVTLIAVVLFPGVIILLRDGLGSAQFLVLFWGTLFTGGITWLSTRQLEQALADSEQRTLALEASEHKLQQQTHALQERTAEAETRQRETAKALRELQIAMQERDSLARSLQESTLPVLPVHQQVVVMPLVGAIDTTRATMLNEVMLHGIEHNRARIIIIDITGVPVIDTQVAGALLRSAEAARLLGAKTILVGVRPEVAQTITGLGLDLSELVVCSDLQTGIQTGLRELNGRTAWSNQN